MVSRELSVGGVRKSVVGRGGLMTDRRRPISSATPGGQRVRLAVPLAADACGIAGLARLAALESSARTLAGISRTIIPDDDHPIMPVPS